MAAAALAPSPAQAAVPFKEIVSAAGPLTSVALGDELSCQVAYRGDARFELFPSGAKPGDCGTLLFTGGTLYAPNFSAHDGTAAGGVGTTTAWTPVSQTEVSGAGTAANPFKVTTVADAGASGVRITQVDTYIAGQESYRTDTTVQNIGGAPVEGILYRGGDCYLQENDTGFGFLDAAAGAVGCSINPNNTPAGRIEQWYPITGGNQYMQGRYSEVWGAIGTHAPLPNTTRATESLDNGAAISWNFSIAPGAQSTYSHYTTFSPTGVAGPPPAGRRHRPHALDRLRPQRPALDADEPALRQQALLSDQAAQEVLAEHRRRDDQGAAAPDEGPAPPAVGHERRPARLPQGHVRRADHGAHGDGQDDQGHPHVPHLPRAPARRRPAVVARHPRAHDARQ